MLWWMAAVALAGVSAPQVRLDWKGDSGTVEIWEPLDHEVATDAPVVLEIEQSGRQLRWESDGASLIEGVPIGVVPGATLHGRLSLTMCSKADGTCTPQHYALQGWTEDRKRGMAILEVEPAAAPSASSESTEHHPAEYRTDAAAIAQGAFDAAKADGKRVILDFGAVWCPPCNLLSAQVFHADEPPAVMEDYHLAVLDVDDPRSFALKDRYDIGGYPTVVVVDADGTEISRQVGYPGREEIVEWLVRARDQEGPDTDFSQVDPASVEPARAAEIAWLLVRTGKDGAEAWIERASEATERSELYLARVSTEPNLDDAKWLADHAPGTAAEWTYPAKSLAETEEGRAVLRRALEADLRHASGSEASDLLYLLAEAARDEDKPMLYAASASVLRSSFTGDPVLDRGHYTWLAVLEERSGDVQGAIERLEQSIALWPDEPTFYLSLADLRMRSDEPEEALKIAREGLAASWGDNKLRVAESVCKALGALDRDDEAAELARATLEEIPAVEEELKVRTHRYREKLQAWVDGTAKK